jgi:hypothetical protein
MWLDPLFACAGRLCFGTGQLLIKLKLVEDPAAPMKLQKAMVLLRIKRHMKRLVQLELEELEDELGKTTIPILCCILLF